MEMYNRKNIENMKWPRKIVINNNATRKIPRIERDTKKGVQKRASIFKGYKRFRRI